MPNKNHKSGFTLVELSIVLVIIGLVVGGVLVGQDLIDAARIRAQISQIEQYQTAVNTFKLKYGYLPGDIPEPHASGFGFVQRGSLQGQGDGNRVIQGVDSNNQGYWSQLGETTTFWVDLSTSGLINNSFNTVTPTNFVYARPTISTTPSLYDYLPVAKIGGGNFIAIWSGGYRLNDGINYFAIAAVTGLWNTWGGECILPYTSPAGGISVLQAYKIDEKIDDALPQAGNVIAIIPQGSGIQWAGYSGSMNSPTPPFTTATSPSSTTCFDNGGNAGTQKYSVGTNDGTGLNCALSFKMQ